LLVLIAVEWRAYRAVALALYIHLCPEAGEIVVEVVDLLLESCEMRRHLLELTTVWLVTWCIHLRLLATNSDSLKLLQQFGAYWHSRLRLPQRWQGVWPLHLILRRLHSLLCYFSCRADCRSMRACHTTRWIYNDCASPVVATNHHRSSASHCYSIPLEDSSCRSHCCDPIQPPSPYSSSASSAVTMRPSLWRCCEVCSALGG
jgi:hypothetical protein